MHPKMTAKDAAEFSRISVQAIHQMLKKQDLPFEKSQNRVYFGHETARALFNLPFNFKVVTFQIVKGGTGKTSTAFNFAIRANLYGARVLCVDLDHQGNMTDFFKVNADEHPVMVDVLAGDAKFSDGIVKVMPGLDLFASRIDNSVIDTELMLKKINLKKVYRELFLSVKNSYDLIVVDCPPSLGHSVAAAALASDLIIAPVNPDQSAIKGLELTAREIQEVAEQNDLDIDLRVLFNKFDKRTFLSHGTLEKLIKNKEFGKRLFSTYISVSQELPNTVDKGLTIFDSLRENSAKTDIDLFVREALQLDDLRKGKQLKKSAPLKVSKKVAAQKHVTA
jgi:chromosome partitioning protein